MKTAAHNRRLFCLDQGKNKIQQRLTFGCALHIGRSLTVFAVADRLDRLEQ
jgi:hypothetical protein